jgi:5'-deoxynucleotidase YfbR-like HD superfamily hydrolase
MIRVKRTQTLAEHSFTVALLSVLLASLLNQPSSINFENLLSTALLHDMHEIEFGDMPTPVKWFIESMPGGPEILAAMAAKFWGDRGVELPLAHSEKIYNLVKLADRLEAYLFYRVEGDDPEIKDRLRNEARAMAINNFTEHEKLVNFVSLHTEKE